MNFIHNYSPTSDCNDYISYVVGDFKESLILEIEEKGFDEIISTKNEKKSTHSLKTIQIIPMNFITSFQKL